MSRTAQHHGRNEWGIWLGVEVANVRTVVVVDWDIIVCRGRIDEIASHEGNEKAE